MLNPPVPPAEEERLAALRQSFILDTPAEDAFDRLTELASLIFHVPFAGINFVDRERVWFKSCHGVALGEYPRAETFCAWVVGQGEALVVGDTLQDARFRDNVLVTQPPQIRFYAGVPLRTADGHAIGTLCLADRRPRALPPRQRALLVSLAAVVMREVELHRATHAEAALREDRAGLERRVMDRTNALVRSNQELRAQVAERQEAERRLAESRQRYKSLFEQNRDAVYSFDRQGRFLSANAACEALCGYSQEELLHLSFPGLIVPEHRGSAWELFLATLAGRPQHGELTITRKDGRRVEISVSKIPIVIDGAVVGAYGISRDVTEHKALERERERLLAEAIERADHDPLTGLLNHLAFQKRFQDALARAQPRDSPCAVALLDLNDFRFLNDAYGHLAGDDVLRLVAQALRDQAADGNEVMAARYGGDEFAVLLPEAGPGGVAAFARALEARLDGLEYRPPGHDSAVPLTLSVGGACFPDDGATRLEILGAADTRLRRAKSGAGDVDQSERLRALLTASVDGFPMLDALMTAVDNKDRYTRQHSEDVLAYSRQIAGALGLDEGTQHTVAVAALLHDVGKIGVPDAVLRKPGRLTDEEFAAVRQHPQMGAVIVAAVPGFEGTLDAIRHHHERWDGGGYPFGLRGEETPLLGRLMAVADAYSAMTTDRPYRKGMSAAQAQAILAAGAGSQWDPQCVAALLHSQQRGDDAPCSVPGCRA